MAWLWRTAWLWRLARLRRAARPGPTRPPIPWRPRWPVTRRPWPRGCRSWPPPLAGGRPGRRGHRVPAPDADRMGGRGGPAPGGRQPRRRHRRARTRPRRRLGGRLRLARALDEWMHTTTREVRQRLTVELANVHLRCVQEILSARSGRAARGARPGVACSVAAGHRRFRRGRHARRRQVLRRVLGRRAGRRCTPARSTPRCGWAGRRPGDTELHPGAAGDPDVRRGVNRRR